MPNIRWKGLPGVDAREGRAEARGSRDEYLAGLGGLCRGDGREVRMAGPLDVVTICGTNIGITVRTYRTFPPPFLRRLAGSSAIEAWRGGPCGFGRARAPVIPRAPKNAPVPLTIAVLPCVTCRGAPGTAEPPLSPKAMMVPIGVPSALKISNVCSTKPFRNGVRNCLPGVGRRPEVNPSQIIRECSLGRLAIHGHDIRYDFAWLKVSRAAVVTLGSVANLVTSEMSPRY